MSDLIAAAQDCSRSKAVSDNEASVLRCMLHLQAAPGLAHALALRALGAVHSPAEALTRAHPSAWGGLCAVAAAGPRPARSAPCHGGLRPAQRAPCAATSVGLSHRRQARQHRAQSTAAAGPARCRQALHLHHLHRLWPAVGALQGLQSCAATGTAASLRQ